MSVYTVCNSICIFRCITSMKMFSNFFNPDSKNFMEQVFVNHNALCHDMLGKYFYDGFITVSIASFFYPLKDQVPVSLNIIILLHSEWPNLYGVQ